MNAKHLTRKELSALVSQYPSNLICKKLAFTLAEVLITLGIIGIVAALTIPQLIANYQKKQTVVQLKKVYTELSQAAQLSVTQNGDMKNWNYALSTEKFFNTYLYSFVKLSSQSLGDVYKSDIYYKGSNGVREQYCTSFYSSAKIVTLASGEQIILSTVAPISDNKQMKSSLVVDLNGFKRPNKFGVDVFVFAVTPDGVLPHQWDDDESYNVRRNRDTLRNGPSGYYYQCNKFGRGMWCAALIMADGWEIKSDYPW